MSLVIDSPACGSLEALFEGVRLGIVAGEPRGRIRDANPEACRLLGINQEALLAMDWERLLAMLGLPDGSSLPQEESRLSQALVQGAPVRDVETGVVRPDGSVVRMSAALTLQGQDRVVLSMTELWCPPASKASACPSNEAVIRESEKRFEKLFNLVPIAVAVADVTTGRILATNRTFREITGWEEHEVVGRTPLEVGLWKDQDERTRAMRQIAPTGSAHGLEVCSRVKDGSLRWIEMSVDLVELEGQRCFLVAALDVTASRRAEEERRALKARAQRAERMQSVGQLAGGVAHDLNNVLAATLGLACVSLQETPPGPLRECLDTIVRASMMGRATLQRLLDFSRKESHGEEPLDLNHIVADVVKILERATMQRVHLEVDLHPKLPRVMGDGAALPHALMDLCVHAVDAMPPGGTLRISTCRHEDGQVLLQVTDPTGSLRRNVLQRVWDVHFASDVSAPMMLEEASLQDGATTPGTALTEAGPSGGTTVVFSLNPSPERSVLPVSGAEPPVKEHIPLRVLLVDDDPILQFALSLQMRHLGHTATAVSRGEDALARIEEGMEVDIVLLDLNMPGLGGACTLPALHQLRPDLPVLLISGRVDEATSALLETNRPSAALPKPFTLTELEKALVSLVS